MGTNNVAQILVPPHPETSSSNSSETYSLELIYKKSMHVHNFTFSSTGFWGKDLSDINSVCCLIQGMRESTRLWYSCHLESTS